MSPAGIRRREEAWGPWQICAALILVAAGMAATWDSWRDIFLIALRDDEESHILLVPAVAAWLVWMRRARLRRCARDHRWVGPLFVAAGWALYSLGDSRMIQAFWHLGAIAVPVGCFLSFAGGRYVARLLPAFAVLVLMVPVPGLVRESVALPLERMTAEATRRVLDVLGADVVRTGNALVVNGRPILIAEACNGLRMAFALLLVSYAFAFGTPIRGPVRALIVAMSPITAIACNVIRLAPTAWVYGYVSEGAGERLHAIGSWVMLPLAFLLLMGLFRSLRWALVPVYRFTLAYGK